MSLIETLVQQLGVNNDQAEGGAGLLLQIAKEKLGSGDFSQLTDLIPDDVEALIGKAPSTAEADAGGGLMGMVGSAADALGMGDAADKLEAMAGLTKGFEGLGLDSGMITQFISAVIDFIKAQGGEQIVTILQSVLK